MTSGMKMTAAARGTRTAPNNRINIRKDLAKFRDESMMSVVTCSRVVIASKKP